jgi:NAD(P)-dependent dehydrogenase (short-subunit alcohol dehydrogenase family)
MSQCIAPVMRDGGGGSIVNIGSMEGYASTPISVAYGASKAALRHLTVSMANEWAAWGIRVNILSPGHLASTASSFVTGDDITVSGGMRK